MCSCLVDISRLADPGCACEQEQKAREAAVRATQEKAAQEYRQEAARIAEEAAKSAADTAAKAAARNKAKARVKAGKPKPEAAAEAQQQPGKFDFGGVRPPPGSGRGAAS